MYLSRVINRIKIEPVENCHHHSSEADLAVAFRIKMVKRGLKSDDIGVRDASIQAIENWGDPDLTSLLAGHVDTEEWLTQFTENVLKSFE